ncbi:hypothetical protein EYC84_004728 [Monilinia fructicola]|uniref:Uncharacterized protein n=1 Tax=Monilinia fructicola TaxID=38448 RepID=A0A5M9K5Y8_MONFR|nr:hypothetical protein EYC84_004728 [Monilinia fructicola]
MSYADISRAGTLDDSSFPCSVVSGQIRVGSSRVNIAMQAISKVIKYAWTNQSLSRWRLFRFREELKLVSMM